jgi:hypothetical protein
MPVLADAFRVELAIETLVCFLGSKDTQVLLAAIEMIVVEEAHLMPGRWVHDLAVKVDSLGGLFFSTVPDGIALVEVLRPVEPAKMAEAVVVFVVEKSEFALAQGKLLHEVSWLGLFCRLCGICPGRFDAVRRQRRAWEMQTQLRPCGNCLAECLSPAVAIAFGRVPL